MSALMGLECPGCTKPIPERVMRRAIHEKKDLRCRCGALRSWKSLPDLPPEQPLPLPPDTATIAEGRAYVESRLTEGVDCPCCGQSSKRLTRALGAVTARGLIALVRASPSGEAVHVKDIPGMTIVETGGSSYYPTPSDFSDAVYWGLCEKASDGEAEDQWRSTDLGRRFVYSMVKVPKYVSLVNGNFEKVHGEAWSIQDALEHPTFDFNEVVWVEDA